MVARRIFTAVVGLPLGVAVIYFGGIWLSVGVGILALMGMREYFSAAETKGLAPSRLLASLSVVGFLLAAHFARGFSAESLLCFMIAAFVLASLASSALRGSTAWAVGNSATTITGIVYVAFLFSFLVLIRNRPGETSGLAPLHAHLQSGFVFVFYLVAVSWLTDTGAFFIGRALGVQKLAPRVSPNKTLEGASGGLLLALVVGIPLGAWMGLAPVHAAILALLGGVVGQIGDLAKSAIKRDAGIKDFGTLFPGHGGVLDRFDSVLFNAPLFYFYLRLVGL